MKNRFLRLGMLCVFTMLMASTATAGALHDAVMKGDMQQVRQLIAQGADVNAPDKKRGISSLVYGVYQASKFELVMANPAGKRNIKDLLYNALNVVKLLIKHGADVNARDKSGKTPLFYTSTRAVAKLLIAHGADVNALDKRGVSPLGTWAHEAARLYRFLTLGQGNAGPRKAEMAAKFHNIVGVIKLLIAHGADVNARDRETRALLHQPFARRYLAQLLIAKGADVNIRDGMGNTPLHGRLTRAIAALLIAKGADVNARDKTGRTPLFYAFTRAVAELLIAKGADVKARDGGGKTPLFYAFTSDVAELLIAKGADANASDKNGVTVLLSRLAWALNMDHSRDMNIRDEVISYDRISNRHIAVIKLLIARGADVNAKGMFGEAPLIYAASMPNADVARLLIAKGADVNARSNGGETPLHRAKTKNIAELLIAKGADVNARDKKGKTPLALAKERGAESIAALLIKHGARE